ncbi:MAG: hypothetical protein EXR62_15895 [Chloroflexi bacterium]|nr:hypothetical protein [Chloroflexota bacterium]
MVDTIRLFVLPHLAGDVKEITLPPSVQNLDQVTTRLPAGPYTTFRTYQGDHFFHLEAHLERLENSAWRLGHAFILDHSRMRRGIREILRAIRFTETRFRVTIPFYEQASVEDIYFAVAPFVSLDPQLYETGVTCLLHHGGRENPLAKSSDFIQRTQLLRLQLSNVVNEVLMVHTQGYILEGLSSNFFGILENQGGETLYTANKDVLEGISRALVLQVAPELLPVQLEAIHISQIPSLKEAFLTSSSRDILPIVRIGETTIGAGFPGPMTRHLLGTYRQALARSVEPA